MQCRESPGLLLILKFKLKITQGDIVEVSFPIPESYPRERFVAKNHPVIIISNQLVYDRDGFFYCVMISDEPHNPEFHFKLDPQMVIGKMKEGSIVKCHLIAPFFERDIIQRIGCLKKDFLVALIEKIGIKVFGIDQE